MGRSMRRGTPYPSDAKLQKRREIDGRHQASNEPTVENNEGIKKSLEGPAVAQLSPPIDIENHDSNGQVVYERKGAFRLKKNEGNQEFRFPKSLSQPEPLWRPGDGFSADEARPEFVSLMKGAHGQRRSRSVPGIGRLQLESEKANGENLRGLVTASSKVQSSAQCEARRRRSAAKDIWPTRDNFSEEIPSRKQQPMTAPNQKIISSTIPPPTLFIPASQARETFKYNPPATKTRQHSDFESFGRRLRDGSTSWPINGVEFQGLASHYLVESEPRADAEYGGGEEDDEPADEMSWNEDPGDEECNAMHEDGASVISIGRASSTGDSGSFVSSGERPKSLEAERPYDAQEESETGERVLMLGQALS